MEVPKNRRMGGGRSLYPFGQMEVGQNFHVPVTDSKPDPCKSLASTVCAATKRTPGKRFIVCRVGVDDEKGPGARVFCVEPNDPTRV